MRNFLESSLDPTPGTKMWKRWETSTLKMPQATREDLAFLSCGIRRQIRSSAMRAVKSFACWTLNLIPFFQRGIDRSTFIQRLCELRLMKSMIGCIITSTTESSKSPIFQSGLLKLKWDPQSKSGIAKYIPQEHSSSVLCWYFPRAQEPYEIAVKALFEHLDRAEEHLSKSSGPYYLGKHLTEVDIRLFVTIVRFDPVYVSLFKCNIRDIRSGYPTIHRWLRNLYWDIPAFRETTNFDQIKTHYWHSLTLINPEVRRLSVTCGRHRCS